MELEDDEGVEWSGVEWTHTTSVLEVVNHLLLHVAQCVRRVRGDCRETGREVLEAHRLEGLLEGAVVGLCEVARAHAGGHRGVFLREGRGGGGLLVLLLLLLVVLLLVVVFLRLRRLRLRLRLGFCLRRGLGFALGQS